MFVHEGRQHGPDILPRRGRGHHEVVRKVSLLHDGEDGGDAIVIARGRGDRASSVPSSQRERSEPRNATERPT